MNENEKGQVSKNAAEIYEEFFVPALFREWADRITSNLNVKSHNKILDVACGTGILARTISQKFNLNGTVTGIDINEAMISEANKKAPLINWKIAKAESLPFENNCFDFVVSQFGLMFFEDKIKSLNEMMRVLKPGGKLTIAVWDTLENTPGYYAMTRLLQRLFGDEAANSLRFPYSLGDLKILSELFTEAGIINIEISTLKGAASFPSISTWVFTDIKGWTLADKLDEAKFNLLLNEAEKEFKEFVTVGGNVVFDSPAHIVTTIK